MGEVVVAVVGAQGEMGAAAAAAGPADTVVLVGPDAAALQQEAARLSAGRLAYFVADVSDELGRAALVEFLGEQFGEQTVEAVRQLLG